jgi:hypothetical protein
MVMAEISPQVTIMRLIHIRGSARTRIMLLGISKITVAYEKHACAQAIDHLAEMEVVQHLQFREADIHATEIRQNITQQKGTE